MVICNNLNLMAPLKDLTDSELQQIVHTNYVSVHYLTKVMVSYFKERN